MSKKMTDEHHSIHGCLRFRRFMAEDLFGNLTEESKKALAGIIKTVRIEKGGLLIANGELFSFYVLKKGRALARYFDHLTSKHTSYRIKKNEVIGLAETLTNSYSMLDIEAISPCVVKSIDRSDLINFLSAEPDICLRIVNKFSLKVNQTYKDIEFSLS